MSKSNRIQTLRNSAGFKANQDSIAEWRKATQAAAKDRAEARKALGR